MKQRDVKNTNFVFVGGTQGMGKATALALAERGASILVLARNKMAGDNLVEMALKKGGKNRRIYKSRYFNSSRYSICN